MINIPPDAIPMSIGADTIVNVLPGGVLDPRRGILATDGAVVNVLGGRVGDLQLENGAVANVESGGINERFFVSGFGQLFHRGGRTDSVFLRPDAIGTLSGGAFEGIGTNRDASLVIQGVGFAIDGAPISGLSDAGDLIQLDLSPGSVLTGTLADGTPFGHQQQPGGTFIETGVLTLEQSANPSPPTPGTIVVDTTSDLPFVRGDQVVQVIDGGRLGEQFRAGPGSRVEVDGGRIDAAFHLIGGEMHLLDGNVGRRLQAFGDAVVTISGGSFDGDATFYRGSILDIDGGTTGTVVANEGATINVRGGLVFSARGNEHSDINISDGEVRRVSSGGGRIKITGGTIVDSLDSAENGVVELSGGRHTDNISLRPADLVIHGSDFRVNGIPVVSASNLANADSSLPNVNLDEGVILSGTYADGTPFVLSGDQEDIRAPIMLMESNLPPAGPPIINVPSDPVPPGPRNGQTLVLDEGGALPDNYTAGFGSALQVRGGNVGRNLEVIGATVDATGGQFSTIDAFTDSTVNLGGSAEWQGLTAYEGARLNIEGGRYTGNNFFRVWSGSDVNISGGDLRGELQVDESTIQISSGEVERLRMLHFSTGTISGGNVDSGVHVSSGSHLLATGGTIGGISTTIGDSILEGVATTTATVDGAIVSSLRSAPFSEITVRSGIAGDTDVTRQGGSLKFYGGALDDSHQWSAGSVEINGYDFRIDGQPITELQDEGDSIQIEYEPGSTLTGTMADGTPFNVRPNDNFNNVVIADGVLTLIQSAPVALPTVIAVPNDPAPYGATAGQTVVVESGGALGPHFLAARNSVVEVRDGEVGENLEADHSQVIVTGGSVGPFADAFEGSTFTIAGGVVGERLEVYNGSVLEIVDGELGRLADALTGSQVEMSGGVLGSGFDAIGASVRITGGRIESGFEASNSSTVVIEGGQIGSSFDANSGSQVIVLGGHFGSSFEINGDATADIRGGSFSGGVALRGDGVVVHIRGGEIAENLLAGNGATIHISGGDIGDSFDVNNATVDITGGTIGERFQLRNNDANVTMSGGSVGDRLELRDGTQMLVSGGQIGDLIRIHDGSTFVLEGFDFALDGNPIGGLSVIGDSLALEDREGALLTGFLADGSPFEFKLNEVLMNPPSPPIDPRPRRLLGELLALSSITQRDSTFDFFSTSATLRLVVAVPEPATWILLGSASVGMLAARRIRRG